MMNKTQIRTGPGYFLEGLRKLPDPALRWFVLLPLLINLLVFAALLNYARHQMDAWITFIIGWLPGFLSFLKYVLWPVMFLALLGGVFFTFTIVGNLIAAPFNGLLAEKVQRLSGANDLPDFGLKDWLTILPRTLGRELKKLGYFLPRALFLLVVSLIPVINLVSPFLWFVFNSWMMSIQYCDYAADNRGVSFNEMLQRLQQARSEAWGFGASVSVALMVPLINLLIMPAAVVGATLLWEQRIEER